MRPQVTSDQPCIVLEDVTLGYDRHPAVHHLSASIAAGSLTALVGPNGAGKTTLLRGIAGALKPMGGRIRTARPVAYLPQRASLDRSFPMSVFDLATMGHLQRAGLLGQLSQAMLDDVERAISVVGLGGFERRPIGTLSGGQLQRALFARLIVQDAPLILLDEPFAAVDAATFTRLLDLVVNWHREGRTVVTAQHDLDLVRAVFPDALLIAREPIAHGPTAQALDAANLARARQLCEAFDDSAAPCERPDARLAA